MAKYSIFHAFYLFYFGLLNLKPNISNKVQSRNEINVDKFEDYTKIAYWVEQGSKLYLRLIITYSKSKLCLTSLNNYL